MRTFEEAFELLTSDWDKLGNKLLYSPTNGGLGSRGQAGFVALGLVSVLALIGVVVLPAAVSSKYREVPRDGHAELSKVQVIKDVLIRQRSMDVEPNVSISQCLYQVWRRPKSAFPLTPECDSYSRLYYGGTLFCRIALGDELIFTRGRIPPDTSGYIFGDALPWITHFRSYPYVFPFLDINGSRAGMSDRFRKVRALEFRDANPGSLINFEVVGQIAPLQVRHNRVADSSNNADCLQNPSCSEFLERSYAALPPWIGSIPALFGFAAIAWGWIRQDKLWSGLALLIGVILTFVGFFVLFSGPA